MTEINPDHPVTKELHDHWQKIVAIIMFKLGIKQITITTEDIKRMGDDKSVVMHAHKESIDVKFMPLAEAVKYAKEHNNG